MINMGRFIYEDETDLWLHASDEERALYASMSKEDRASITSYPDEES